MRQRIKSRAPLKVKPPDVADFIHVFAEAAKDPDPVSPDIRRMVESADEPPRPRPGERLQVQVTDILQHVVIVTGDAADDEQLVFMQNGRVPCAAPGDGAGNLRLRPVSVFEVKDNEVGKVSSVLVLAAEDEELVALVQRRSVAWSQGPVSMKKHQCATIGDGLTHPNTGNISVVVYQAPLVADEV